MKKEGEVREREMKSKSKEGEAKKSRGFGRDWEGEGGEKRDQNRREKRTVLKEGRENIITGSVKTGNDVHGTNSIKRVVLFFSRIGAFLV